MTAPRPGILEDFEREALYDPSAWFVHEVLGIDREAHRITALVDTTRLGPFVEAQRPHAGHERHVPGAIAIQVTGTLGNLHAVYVMGLRPTEGWVGYGTHVRDARFRRMGTIGPPVIAVAECYRRRQLRGVWFLDYRFRFEQENEPVYESEQTAIWRRSP